MGHAWMLSEAASTSQGSAVGFLLSLGYAPLSKENAVQGREMPTRNVPPWGSAKRSTETGVLVRLKTP